MRPIGVFIPAVCLTLGAYVAQAQVVTDGSLGAATTLTGPNFFIDDALGQTRGGNLFHSFGTFNIAAQQTAVFDSTPGILNVIARVTGPSASRIDGLLVANANLFLLNPRGVLFGATAQLDVAGSFSASSADYLGFADGARFHTTLGAQSALSIAAPTAFGFLDANSGPISLSAPILAGSTGRSLSFIGGDVTLEGVQLSLERGRIDLVATASAGEVRPTATTLDTSSFSAMGNLRVRQSLINAFDEEGTSIYIRAGQFVMESESLMVVTTTQAGTPRALDIDVDRLTVQGSGIAAQSAGTGLGTPITIRADQISVGNDSAITTLSAGAMVGGDINVQTGSLTIAGGSLSFFGTGSVGGAGGAGDLNIRASTIDIANGALSAVTAAEGDAGDINVIADRVSLGDGGAITSGTTGRGDGGVISIEAGELVLESGSAPLRAAISVTSNNIGTDAGNAGTIQLDVDTLRLRNGHISSSTAGPGDGGAISIDVDELIMEQTASITTDTGIVGAFGPAQSYGRGGGIGIRAGSIEVLSGSRISASTFNDGAGGTVSIAAESLTIDGVSEGAASAINATAGAPQIRATGAGGNILLDVGVLALTNGAAVSANTFGPGNAGRIDIVARDVLIDGGASVTNASHGSGNAGSIMLNALESLRLQGFSAVTTEAESASGGNIALLVGNEVVIRNSTVSTSVLGGGADGGNILIDSSLLLLDSGSIIARAVGGNGGAIDIAADFVLRSSLSLIDASSQLGIDGPVAILGFEADLNVDIAALPSGFLDARQWLAQPCASRLGTNVSRFTVNGRDGAYRSPADFAPSPLLFEEGATQASVGWALAQLGDVGLKPDPQVSGCQ